MFPLCHIYFAEKLINKPTDYTLLGSIYPDAVISGELKRDTTHYNTKSLYDFFADKDEKMKEFAVGAMSHGVDMRGLDYCSDEHYPGFSKGYCFGKAREIKADVIKCCYIPDEWGLWKAHNFIEMAFELYLYKKDKSLIEKFNNMLADSELISIVCLKLARFYEMDTMCFKTSFHGFSKFFEYGAMDEIKLAQRYSLQLKAKHGIDMFRLQDAASVISHAVDIIRPDIDTFFNYAISEAGKTINSI